MFSLPITITKDEDTIHERVSTTNAVVTVIFRGVNEAPELTIHHLDGVVHEDAGENGNLNADGQWRVTDSDAGDHVNSVWGAKAGAAIENLAGITRNETTGQLQGSQDIVGKYGTLTINADGSWTYLAVQDKIERLNNGETDYDVFHIRVRDSGTRNSDSDVQTISISLVGHNDVPLFTFVEDDNFHTRSQEGNRADTNAAQRDSARSTFQKVAVGTNNLSTVVVPISTILLLAGTHAAADANADNSVSGTWTARDDDDDAVVAVYNGTTRGGELRMNRDNDATSGDNPAGGKMLDGTSGAITNGEVERLVTFDGKYGSLTLFNDGTWKYRLTNDAEVIAKDETPIEEFNLRLEDEHRGTSEVINVRFMLRGFNDAPEDLINTAYQGVGATTGADARRSETTDGELILGTITEAGARYGNDDNTRDETDGDAINGETEGVSTIRGTFDAVDQDKIGSNSQPSAIDEHMFGVVNAEQATRTVVQTFNTEAGKLLAQLTKSAYDGFNKAAFTTALGALPAGGHVALVAAVKDAIANLDGALDGDNEQARQQDFAVKLIALKNAVVTLSFAALDVTFLDATVVDDPNLPDPAALNDRNNGNPLEPIVGDDRMSSMVGVYGTMTVNKYTGEWAYVVNNRDVHSQALDKGATAFDIFQIVIMDEEGAMVIKTVRIRITGEDDAPKLYLEHDGNDDDKAITEKGNDSTGQVTDPDGQARGTFGIYDHDGEDAAVLVGHTASAAGQSHRAAENSTHFTFFAMSQITAANHVAADGDDDSNGTAGLNDVETGTPALTDTNWESGWAIGKFGVLKIERDGDWTYVLAENDAVFDGTGLADAPDIVGGGDVAGMLAVHLGLLTQAQVDAGNTISKADARAAIIKRVTKLNDGDSRKDHFAIKVQDASGLDSNVIQLSLDITGANDAPTVEAASFGPRQSLTGGHITIGLANSNTEIVLGALNFNYELGGTVYELTVAGKTISTYDSGNAVSGSGIIDDADSDGANSSITLYIKIDVTDGVPPSVSYVYHSPYNGSASLPSSTDSVKYLQIGTVAYSGDSATFTNLQKSTASSIIDAAATIRPSLPDPAVTEAGHAILPLTVRRQPWLRAQRQPVAVSTSMMRMPKTMPAIWAFISSQKPVPMKTSPMPMAVVMMSARWWCARH